MPHIRLDVLFVAIALPQIALTVCVIVMSARRQTLKEVSPAPILSALTVAWLVLFVLGAVAVGGERASEPKNCFDSQCEALR